MAEYQILRSQEELDATLAASHERTVVIFKHSLTCPISSRAFREYEQFLADRNDDDGIDYTLIEIQRQRELSNAVTEHTGVRHESPQALLFRNGTVTWNASHGRITSQSLNDAVSAS